MGFIAKTLTEYLTGNTVEAFFGFKTMGVYLPAEDIYVVGFSNCDCNSPTQLTRDIAKFTLETLTKK